MAITSIPGQVIRTFDDLTSVTHTISAVNHNIFTVGRIILASGPGTSKVISSAGGKVILRTASVTFANAGTTARVGLQDVSLVTGLIDGTFDTYVDLVGGGGGLSSDAYVAATLANGSKTLTHGDLIAAGIQFTTHGGADVVQLVVVSSPNARAYAFPYTVRNSGFGNSKDRETAIISIVTDDGTPGWIVPISMGAYGTLPSFAIQVGSTPDEYAAVFTTAVQIQIDRLGMLLGALNTTDAFDWIIYSDPLGTPAVVLSGSANLQLIGSTAGGPFEWWGDITPTTLDAGTYGIAIRPTSANVVNVHYYNPGTGMEPLKASTFFGTTLKMAARTDQTGPFVETDAAHVPSLLLRISGMAAGGADITGVRFRNRNFIHELSLDDGATWVPLRQEFNNWYYDGA
jgi:hypothetical protein